MTLDEITAELRARATQSVPFTGEALGGTKRGAAYAAAAAGTLGVPVFWSGGKLRTASIDIARRLGIEDAVAPVKNEQQVTPASPLAAATPAIQSATRQPAPARSRKATAPNAITARKTPARERKSAAKSPAKSNVA